MFPSFLWSGNPGFARNIRFIVSAPAPLSTCPTGQINLMPKTDPLSLCARSSHICNSHDGRLHMFLESIAWRLHGSIWPVWVVRAISRSLYPRRQVFNFWSRINSSKTIEDIAGNLCCRFQWLIHQINNIDLGQWGWCTWTATGHF